MPLTNPVDHKSIEDALRAWLTGSTGVTFIRAKQGRENPRPAFPFGTYELRGVVRHGADDEQIVLDGVDPDTVVLRATGLRRATLSCNVWSNAGTPNQDSAAICDRAVAALSLDTYREPLNQAQIGIIDVSEVRDLDALENNQWISRSQFDVRIHIVSVAEEQVEIIKTVEVSAFDETESPLWENPQTFQIEPE